MSLIVRGRIDVHLDDADAGVVCMLSYPIGRHEHISHSESFLLPKLIILPREAAAALTLLTAPASRIARCRDR
jgi:hypothetical protein